MHIHSPNFLTSAVSGANFEVTVMGYENELNRDEAGGPLVDFDKTVGSEGIEPEKHALNVACINHNERPPIPVYSGSNSKCRKLIIKLKLPGPTPVNNDSNSKCRKLLIKLKSGSDLGPGLDGDGVQELVRDDYADGKKRKSKKGENKKSLGKKRKVEKKSRVKKSAGGRMRDHDADSEIKEMWDTIVGDNCEVGSP